MGDPLPGPEVGLWSNTRKRIVRGDTCWQSKRFYWEGHPGGEQESKGTQENCSAVWLTVLGFMVMGLVSGWSLANHSNSVFPGGARIAQPRWMLARGILGSGRTGSVSSRPFPNSSGWWWLISSVSLIRFSCRKKTHANGYYGAWPGWAVSISVLPLTGLWKLMDYNVTEQNPEGPSPTSSAVVLLWSTWKIVFNAKFPELFCRHKTPISL